MHVNVFDRYRAVQSMIHRLDPRVKVAVTLLFILSNVLLPDGAWIAFLLSWGLVLLVSWLARLGIGYVVTRSFIAIPFALTAVATVFNLPGKTVAAVEIGGWMFVVSDVGLVHFFSILLRSWLSVQMAIILVTTTQIPDVLHAMLHLRLPGVLVAIISFMYRYLFVLVDEAMRLVRAREARSARLGEARPRRAFTWQAKVTGNMAGQLFVRSFDRSERVYHAMLARGYQGELLTVTPHKFQPVDWAFFSAAITALAVVQFVGRLIG
jgi:cobalt/nickel transport system permease protein